MNDYLFTMYHVFSMHYQLLYPTACCICMISMSIACTYDFNNEWPGHLRCNLQFPNKQQRRQRPAHKVAFDLIARKHEIARVQLFLAGTFVILSVDGKLRNQRPRPGGCAAVPALHHQTLRASCGGTELDECSCAPFFLGRGKQLICYQVRAGSQLHIPPPASRTCRKRLRWRDPVALAHTHTHTRTYTCMPRHVGRVATENAGRPQVNLDGASC